MPRNKGGGVLTDAKKKKLQARLAHFFRDYRYRNDLEPKDVAKKLGYDSVARYSTLESENIPYPRFVTALDFLASIAALEGMELGEFVRFLEGKEDGDRPTVKGRPLAKWEESLLDAFAPMSIGTRRKFSRLCQQVNGEVSKKKFELMVEMVTTLADRDEKAVEALHEALKLL